MTSKRQLRDFQDTGSVFLQRRKKALLCDDAGLGKSLEVLDAADALGLSRVLCIAPAVAGVSWPVQLRTWSPSRKFVNLDLGQQFGFDLPGFYFVSYDTLSLRKNAALITQLSRCRPWDAIVLDEGQYLKSPGANRTIAVYGDTGDTGIATNAKRVWVLSGTLTPNHAGEAYTHLRRLLPGVIQAIPAFSGRVPEQHEFEDRYCKVRDTVYGRIMDGSKNQKELRKALSPHLLRRLKRDVLPELPPLDFLTAPIDLDPAFVQQIYADMLAREGLTGDFRFALDEVALTDIISSNPNLASQRRTLGLAKVPACARWIIDRLEAGEPKIVVFAHHREVLSDLFAKLMDYNPVLFHGGTPPAERDEVVNIFQTVPACRVFVGQLIAAGTCITLTAAKTVFLAEYAGTPGVNHQAASRCHRLGQRDGVQAYFGSVPGTLDERIASTAARRAREIAELFD
jgi:SWI/SNF-related matrix-associated actin-dependent regulator 1 of chromatin subfamily A